MKSVYFFIVLIVPMWALEVLAQVASPTASPAAVNAVNGVVSKIPDSLPTWVLAIVGFLITSVVMHKWPTAQPLSWFTLARDFLKALSTGFGKLANLADQLVAQNIKKD